MSVKRSVASHGTTAEPRKVLVPVNSIWTSGSSPTTQASWSGGRSTASPARTSTRVPSLKTIPPCPETTAPMWRARHQSPPTSGFTWRDHRQPGWWTTRAMVKSPSSTMSSRVSGNSTVRSGAVKLSFR